MHFFLQFTVNYSSFFTEYEAVPKGKSLDMLFDYVEKYKEVQGAMVDSMEHLTEISRDEKVGNFIRPSAIIKSFI